MTTRTRGATRLQRIPRSFGRRLHDSVPAGIIEDYAEAHSILEESPKAAATLARRAIQGMIRDFHGISKRTLKAEIDALEELVEADVWAAIDVVRSVGNIGAHMERDVDVIIEVEPNEAENLLGLVTLLSDDWYKSKADREQRLADIKEIGEKKEGQKNAARNDVTDPPATD